MKELTEAELESLFQHAKATILGAGQLVDEPRLREVLAATLGRAEAQGSTTRSVAVTDGGTLRASPAPTHASERDEGFWYESEDDRLIFDWHIQGHKNHSVEGALLLMGPAGSGKTESVIRAGDRTNTPVHIINVASITTIEKWVGERGINADGTYFRLSDVMEILRGEDPRFPPGIALFDEITRLPGPFHNIMFPLLDNLRRIWIPEMHDYLHVHPDVNVMATANIGGRYTGTYTMDHAMRSRFRYTIERDFPPPEAEVRILTSKVGISPEQAAVMVDIANRTRRAWRSQDLQLPIDTRCLLAASAIVRDGGSIARAFEVTALPMFSGEGGEASERYFVKGVIHGKGGTA